MPNAGQRSLEIARRSTSYPAWIGGIFDDSPEWGSTAVLAPWYVLRARRAIFLALLSHIAGDAALLGLPSPTRANNNIVAYGIWATG